MDLDIKSGIDQILIMNLHTMALGHNNFAGYPTTSDIYEPHKRKRSLNSNCVVLAYSNTLTARVWINNAGGYSANTTSAMTGILLTLQPSFL